MVRNPCSTIYEYANLSTMQSDKLFPNEAYHAQFPNWWNQWVKQTAKNISLNHDYIMKQASRKAATFFIRYEDLILKPQAVLEEIFKFLLEVNSLTGSIVEKRINEVVNKNLQKPGKQTQVDKRHMFSLEQTDFIKSTLEEYILFFDYDEKDDLNE